MKSPKKEILFMFEESKNHDEISISHGQDVPMDNNLPPLMLGISLGISHQIPEEKPGNEIQESLSMNQSIIVDNMQKRKSYNRYSEHQIQFLEAFFKKCPHPNHWQRKELGNVLGIDPLKVKFWFQNKHTKLRLHLEHEKMVEHDADNKSLLTENFYLKRALTFCTCQICGGPLANQDMRISRVNLLKSENNRLKEEIKQVTSAILQASSNPQGTLTSIPSSLSNDDQLLNKKK